METQVVQQLNPDSYEWDTPSKGGAKKVYCDLLNNPKDAGVKVERIKLLQKLAVGEINIDEYNEKVILIG